MTTASAATRQHPLVTLLVYALAAAPGIAAFWYLAANDPGIAVLSLP